ncbi:MAG: 1-(5-phosphoribosyl)-5-((5-phosphoribosylamino)methylideneamino)imidazole-4-carboxamide isomerase, partial [Chloroflexi bacterium]|nr:1-(5-phosphoribosyl)-5-((5-phosphoribosylamino)methylideneamino)imidazole-4-carboxamide isomerase [Chloroflexota bacterium]
DLCGRYGDRVVVGIDVRDGQVATEGWLTSSPLATDAVVQRANAIGVRRGLFTDIDRDGTLGGPNLEALRRVVEAADFDVIASGGVASLEDVEAIRCTGAGAVILGRALYTGAIDLQVALARVSER